VLKFLRVNFNGIDGAPFRLSHFRYTQAKYQHELAYLTFNEWDTSIDFIKPGIPVDFEIKDPKGVKKFYGYVHHVEPSKTPGSDNVTVVVIGASYLLKQARQEVYKNITASELAISIAKRYNFSYGVTPHPRVYPQIAQSGQSDWQLLVRLAKQCGYSLRAENTELYFKPLDEDFSAYKGEALRFYMNDANNPEGSTIYSFKPIVGETLSFDDSGTKSATAISGMSIRDAKTAFAVTKQNSEVTVRTGKQKEFFDRFDTHTVVTDYASAVYEAEALDMLTRYPYRASVEVLGNTELKPDMPIYLEGLGEDYSGYWTIIDTEHIIDNLVYTTKLTVGLDSLGTANIWKDGKSLASVPNPDLRTVTPGTYQTNVKPKTALKVTQQGNLLRYGYSISSTQNKPNVETTEKTVVAWASVGKKDLNSAPVKSARSAIVSEKLRSQGVL
jgi:phage protein D